MSPYGSDSVTVVIPTKDRPDHVRTATELILGQREVDARVVVVDDGSAAPIVVDDDRVLVVRHDRSRGVASARNTGLDHVDTEWVAFCDDDDLWLPGKLAAQLHALRSRPWARWCAGGALQLDADLRLVGYRAPPAHDWVDRDLLHFNAIPGGGSGVLASTALVREVGRFDRRLSTIADWDLYIRLALVAPIASIDVPLLGYVRHPDSMSLDQSAWGQELAIVRTKYRQERIERGVDQDDVAYRLWVADNLRKAGDRRGAVKVYLSALRRSPSPRIVRPLAVTLAGRRVIASVGARRLRAVDVPDEATRAAAQLRQLVSGAHGAGGASLFPSTNSSGSHGFGTVG